MFYVVIRYTLVFNVAILTRKLRLPFLFRTHNFNLLPRSSLKISNVYASNMSTVDYLKLHSFTSALFFELIYLQL